MNFKQFLSILVSISIVFTQTVSAAGIQIDNSASKKPTLSKALNNIPIINIVKPNSSGLSHNKFKNYNVNKQGLILNNSNKAVNTQLSGFIPLNANLQGSHARVILNEVTGTSRTLLQGFTEVAGVSADVIVANPNGISVNGGGFINTPKATLTTGNPLINSGLLKGFDVSKGDIWIEGDGFNANNINSVALFSKALHVNAKFYANKVDIVLGENIINTNGTITSKDSLGSGIALDSSLLGGIYANTITLVSNDKGVGVNLPPEVFAQKSLTLNAKGDITLQKTIVDSLHVRSSEGTISTKNIIQVNNNLVIDAKNSINIEGTLYANNINLTSSHSSVKTTKAIESKNNLDIKAKNNIDLKGTLLADSIHIRSNEGAISIKETTQATASLVLNAKNSINIEGTLYANNINLTSSHSSVKTTKAIESKNNLDIKAKDSININGTLKANSINIKSSENSITTNEALQSSTNLNIEAKDNIDLKGTLLADSIHITSDEAINTTKAIQATNNLVINAKKDINIDGILIAKNIDITSINSSISNDKKINATNAIRLNAKNNVIINASLLSNTLNINSQNDIYNNAGIYGQTINLNALNKIYNKNELSAIETIYIQANHLENKGLINGTDLTIRSNSIENYETIFGSNNIKLYVNDLLYNYENANILAINNLHVSKNSSNEKTKKIINNKANIETIDGDITFYAQEFVNTTDPLVKSEKTVNSEYFDSSQAVPVNWAASELLKEGTFLTASDLKLSSVCTQRQEGSCVSSVPVYTDGSNFKIFTPFIASLDSYIVGYKLKCTGNDGGNCHDVPIYRYNIKYVSKEKVILKLNQKYNKYGVGIVAYSNFFSKVTTFRFKDTISNAIKRRVSLTTKEETQGNTLKPATLISGKKLTLHVNKIRNYLSQIASNDTLSIYADILNNEGERLYNIHTLSGRYYYKYKDGGWFHSDKHKWADIPSKTTYKLIGNVYSSIYSAKDIVGNIAVVNNVDIKSNQAPLGSNGTTKKKLTQEDINNKKSQNNINNIDKNNPTTSLVDITLPKGQYGLFVLAKDKKADFLIETNPKFTIFKNFISSDYMMEKLNLDPLATQKRLGDNFYENRLVRESIFSQTGKRYLSDTINDDYTQYKYLMDNALNQRVALNLTPTVALTQKQINALTSDIVWMEETIVAGEKVLVPHVYIANLDNLKLNDRASAIVAKQNITLQVNSLVNMGKIEAGNNLVILANKTIANLGGKLSSQADTTLIANESIVNISADIKADSLHVATKTFHSDVGITKLKKELDLGEEVNELVSNSSTIQANKNITINTINNLNLIGTDVKAKGDINLASTKGNVNILSKQSNNEFDNKTATGYLKTSQTNQISSNLEANNINITSNSLHVKASNLSAKENINVNVKKSITIEAGENREYSDFKHKIKGSFLGGKLKQQDTIDNTTLITSTLKAKNINLTANQINLIASQIKADEVKITTEVLRLISQKNSSYESHFKDSSGLMTRTIATKGHIKEEVVKAQIEVTKQLILNNKDITNKLQHSGINDKKIQTRISQELQTDNIIKTLSSQHNLTHDQIELVKAYAKSKEWDESHTSLTTVGAIIVAIVVTVITAGIGTGEAVAGLSAAQAAANTAAAAATASGTAAATAAATSAATALTTATITAAATNAIVAGIATQVATAAITGESFKLDVKSLIKGALVAGLLTGVTAFADSAQGIKGVNYKDLSIAEKITKGVTHSTIKAGVNSAVYGTDFKDGFVSALTGEVGASAFHYIGHDIYGENSQFPTIRDNIPKTVIHGLVGGTLSELAGGDFTSGAIATATSHVVGEYVKNKLFPDLIEGKITLNELKTQVQTVSKLVNLTVTLASNKDLTSKELLLTQDLGESVVENNVLGTIALTLIALSTYLNAPDSDDEIKTGPTGLAEFVPPVAALSAIYELTKNGISKETAIIAIMKKLKIPKSVAKRYYDKALYSKVKNIQNKDGWTQKQISQAERKKQHLLNKIKDGKVKPNSKHGITKAERQKITTKYRKDLKKRINTIFKDNPTAKNNALTKLENSDIDHKIDLQLNGSNTRPNVNSLDKSVNRSYGKQLDNILKDLGIK